MKPKIFFGEFFHQKRIEKGMTLRAFCEAYGFDPGNLSRIERGLLAPPSDRQKLVKYVNALGLKRGSAAWIEFFDRAAMCKGEIPEEFYKDEELIKKLPLIFRTIRGKKVADEKLDELIEIIRES